VRGSAGRALPANEDPLSAAGSARPTLLTADSFLCRFYHVAGAEAAGADPDVLDGALLYSPDPAQIGLPAPLGMIVGVADIVTHLGPFAANITYVGHDDACSFLRTFYFT